ncbi:hypothetical protein [Polaromonas sp. UC242_47]|uniref:hypothetical protein n=1 Tax=Polaromonas sp. UC242_47 TaxID=3374626 RepID=UPI0037B135DF
MLDILNIAYLAGILLSSITLYPDGETPISREKDSYTPITFYREWWREDGKDKCSFKGMLVPYTRTWPEEVKRGEDIEVLPPEPDKVAGYVALVNRQECVGKPPVTIFRAGLARPRKLLFGNFQLDKHGFFPAGDMLESPADKLPPWLPQVVARMELLAQKDDAAKSFLAASASELDKVLPGRTAKAIPEATEAGVDAGTATQVMPQVNAPQDPPTSN